MFDRMKTLSLWQTCEISPNLMSMITHMAQRVMLYKTTFYDPVEKATGVPWYVVGVIDMREEDFNHGGYLGNGDPLWKRTTHVPANRGPFKTWFEGAIDALTMRNFNHLPVGGHWDTVTSLIQLEKYNGMGYNARHLNSPYVWASTNHQMPGKYTSDGHFDQNAYDSQPGCAGVLLALKRQFNVDVGDA